MVRKELMGYDALIARLYGSDESNTTKATSTSEATETSIPTKQIINNKVWLTYWDKMQEPEAPDVEEVRMKQFENGLDRLSLLEIEIYLRVLKKRKAELV